MTRQEKIKKIREILYRTDPKVDKGDVKKFVECILTNVRHGIKTGNYSLYQIEEECIGFAELFCIKLDK